jgi:membrane-associated protease RseP (regulator of RpoE activity)
VLLLEGVIRRDLSMQLKERLMQFGFILLVTLMGVVISLDVIKNWVG